MNLFTIGFTQKTAEQFFSLIEENQIELLVDIRLNNKSQLAGFTKGDDLCYFLRKICNCDYRYCEEYAPTKNILDRYKKKEISWSEYVLEYTPLMKSRKAPQKFIERFQNYNNVCLLCSEPTPEQCHRRLFAEMIKDVANEEIKIIHI